MILGSITVFHGEAIGIGQSLSVAVSYLLVAGLLFRCAKYASFAPHAAEPAHETGMDADGMPAEGAA